jgi:NADH-quinone oxidoreductase subunit M
MISHGLVSSALFLCVGVLYDRKHTYEIAAYGGLVARMPLYAAVFMIFTLANIGLPGTSGFIGEFLTLIGTFKISSWVGLLAATGTILSVAYALYLYRRIIFGVLDKPSLSAMGDLSWREAAVFAPLIGLTIFYGVRPAPILDSSAASIDALIKGFDTALAVTKAAALTLP